MSAHYGAVTCAAYSASGTAAATGASDGCIRVWSSSTGEETAQLEGHTSAILGLSFLGADGAALLSLARDRCLRKWSVAAAREVRQRGDEAGRKGEGERERERVQFLTTLYMCARNYFIILHHAKVCDGSLIRL